MQRLRSDGGIVEDQTISIEHYIGSDFADVIYGGTGDKTAISLSGGREDDTIYAEGTQSYVFAGAGDGMVIAGLRTDLEAINAFDNSEDGAAGIDRLVVYDGGTGFDTIDYSDLDGFRLNIDQRGLVSVGPRPLFRTDITDVESGALVGRGRLEGFEKIIATNGNDLFFISVVNKGSFLPETVMTFSTEQVLSVSRQRLTKPRYFTAKTAMMNLMLM